MYNIVSNEFKEIVKSNSITATAKVVFKEPNITLYGKAMGTLKSSLKDVTITDNCYNNGQLIGTTMAKEAEINIINKDNLDLADKEFELYVGIKLSNGEYEYIPYGNFAVTEYEDTKSNNVFNMVAYDYMTKFNPKYGNNKFNPIFPITLKDFKEQFVASYGLQIEEQTLPNDDFIVKEMPFLDGMTGRTILSSIAQLQGSFAKINRNNKVQFYSKTETSEKIDANSMNSNLEIDKQYGPVNVVSLGMSNVEGENVTLKDDPSIAEYGETTIRIDDNPFVYTQVLREKAINQLYNHLKGFTYIPTKFNYKARLYTDCGDIIKVENVENKQFVNSIILNQHIKIPATRQSTLENLALSNTEVKNKYISQTEQKNTHTEIIVDKQNQKIESVASQTNAQNQKISKIEQSVDEINSKISDIADTTIMKESQNGVVELEKVNASEPVDIKIHPIIINISYLYPNSGLFPSNNLFGKVRKLRFTNIKDNSIIDYELPANLLYYDKNNYDEFILNYDSKTCKIIKKVGYNSDGTTYLMPSVKEINFPYPKINLTDGDYKVELLGYKNAYLMVRLMAQNIYTTQFATRVEMNSAIDQKAESINLSVDRKFENYSTTSEMNTAINLSADNINSEVRKKVGKDEVGTEIQQNAEAVKIAWNKVGQAIQLEKSGENAEIQVNDGNSRLMTLNKNGQKFYKNNTEFGKMGVSKDKDGNTYISFAVPIDYNSSIRDGMAWGVTTPSGNFYPIFTIRDFRVGGANTGDVSGKLELLASDLLVGGNALTFGGITIAGAPDGQNLDIYDTETGDMFMSIIRPSIVPRISRI